MNNHQSIQEWKRNFKKENNRLPTHLEITEKMLRTFEWTTPIDARPYNFEGSFRSRVSNLRKKGLPIVSKKMPVMNSEGKKTYVHGHRLMEVA